jgi:hypothetical protein
LTPENFDKLAILLDRIPQREADLLYLYFIENKRQQDIATIFDVTQAAVSYRLDRGLKRIKFLLDLPSVTTDEMERDLPKVPFRDIDVNILVGMWQTTCQSEVAKQLGLTQGRVRHRFFKAVQVLEEASSKNDLFQPYSKIFSAISKKKFNILREVKLPQWASRGGDRVALGPVLRVSSYQIRSMRIVSPVQLQSQDYSFQYQTPQGVWRWTVRVDLSGAFPTYEVRDVFSPFGLFRDRVPIPGDVVTSMAQAITDLQSAFPPALLVAPLSLTFTVDEGRGLTDPQAVSVTNAGVYGSLLDALISTSAAYVRALPTQLGNLAFNEAGTFDVVVDSTSLLAVSSPYAETLTLQDTSATNSPQVVSVSIVVRSKAHIVLAPSALTFTIVKPLSGPFPVIPNQIFTITNTGAADSLLTFLVQKLTGCGVWISSISPLSGSIAGGSSQIVTVTVTPAQSLPVGTYTEILRVSGYSDNSYQDVTVTLVVT